MTFFHFILIGFFFSFLGSIPFGPVNLSMVDTTLNKGFKNGLHFATAASLVEILQATAALYLGIKMTEYLVFTKGLAQVGVDFTIITQSYLVKILTIGHILGFQPYLFKRGWPLSIHHIVFSHGHFQCINNE